MPLTEPSHRARKPNPAPTPAAREHRGHEAFAAALERLQAEIEAELGEKDARYIRRVGRTSRALEVAGRGLIHFSFEPLGFGLGVGALWAHKCLELMEIGHMALHGAFDGLPDTEPYRARAFHWKAPIDEASWRRAHNVRHHQYTNIEGRDPDLSFGALRLSERVPYLPSHVLQPVTNALTWLGFANGIGLHVTGMLDLYLTGSGAPQLKDRDEETVREAKRTFARKFLRYHAREYVLFPLLAGPFWWKTLLGNALSEVGRDVYAGAVIYCGHVGAKDFPAGTKPESRGHWYVMQAESARDIDVPWVISVLSGALDKQIEHHLFPRMPPNRLREVAPRVKEICREHGVRYLEKSWPATLRDVFGELRRLSKAPKPAPAAA